MFSTEALTLISFGVTLSFLYGTFSMIEPFCYYLPGGIGKLYKLHKGIKTRFSDVIGNDELKSIIADTVSIFQQSYGLSCGESSSSNKYTFLFQGPSGTGKTFTAQAVAGECGLPFIEILARDRTRDVMPTVINTVIKKYAPCIIFIDEAHDLLGFNSDYMIRALDSMTACKSKVIFIFATNKADKIDDSILRHNRIDKIINFSLPVKAERLLHIKKALPSLTDTQLQLVSSKLGQVTQAQLNFLQRELQFMQQRRLLRSLPSGGNSTGSSNSNGVTIRVDTYLSQTSAGSSTIDSTNKTVDVSKADNSNTSSNDNPNAADDNGSNDVVLQDIYSLIERLQLGYHNQSIKSEIDDETKRRIAIHEIGHAIVAFMLKQSVAKPTKVSLNSAGGVAGYNIINYNDCSIVWTKQMMTAIVASYLGGYVAEKHFYHGNTSTLAIVDLRTVVSILDTMADNLMIKRRYRDVSFSGDATEDANSSSSSGGRKKKSRKHGGGSGSTVAAVTTDQRVMRVLGFIPVPGSGLDLMTSSLVGYESVVDQLMKFLSEQIFETYHDDILRLAELLIKDETWETPQQLSVMFSSYRDKLDIISLH